MATPTPTATSRRPFHLSVSVDSEMLLAEPGLAGALVRRLEDHVDPPCSVSVAPGDFIGFTVEASSQEDIEELGPRGGARLASGLRWVEDQAVEILDRIFYPTESIQSTAVRAGMATASAIIGRLAHMALVLGLLVVGAGSAQAGSLWSESRETAYRVALECSCALVAEVPVAGPDISIKKPLAIFGASIGADWVTTEMVLAREGSRELNPIMRGGPLQRGLIFGAQIAIGTWSVVELRKHGHDRWARAVEILVPTVHMLAAGSNVHQLRKDAR